MKVLLRTNPDRSRKETTFKEEEILLTGGIYGQIRSLLAFADNEFKKHWEYDKVHYGSSRWDWWRTICQKTWAEIKFFPNDQIDESFDLLLRLEFPVIDWGILDRLGIVLILSRRHERGSANFKSIFVYRNLPSSEALSLQTEPGSFETYSSINLMHKVRMGFKLEDLRLEICEQDSYNLISLLLASLEAQVREVSAKFWQELTTQTTTAP